APAPAGRSARPGLQRLSAALESDSPPLGRSLPAQACPWALLRGRSDRPAGPADSGPAAPALCSFGAAEPPSHSSAAVTVVNEPNTTTRSPARASDRARLKPSPTDAASRGVDTLPASRAARSPAVEPRGPEKPQSIQASIAGAIARPIASTSLSLKILHTAYVLPSTRFIRRFSSSTCAAGSLCETSRIHSTVSGAVLPGTGRRTVWKRPCSRTARSASATRRPSSGRRPAGGPCAAPDPRAAGDPDAASDSYATSAVAALRYWMRPARAGRGRPSRLEARPR